MKNYRVERIESKDAKPFILGLQYAQRMPSISYAYGIFLGEELLGICTIGKPASNPLCVGVCGKEYSHKVFELNRLCMKDKLGKNVLSFFVSKVLKDLKKENLILISYADTGMNHSGYIYQATNWMYTGLTAGRTDKYTPENKHSRHYTNEFNHLRKVRTAKHRYIYVAGDKRFVKEVKGKIRYEEQPYPKGTNSDYELGTRQKTKILNTEDNTVFYQ
ncbi:DNA modification protein [Listeria phage LP-013]|uniref:DNA modification protein n=1 Tax=Listeria phage LP-013 TaxID=2590047 RepID=A0A514U6Y4_9CAUD|nr:DNA modification protein [Listeria phage LP-013]